MKIRTCFVLSWLLCFRTVGGAQDLPRDFVVEKAVSGGSAQVPAGMAFAPNGKMFAGEKRGRVTRSPGLVISSIAPAQGAIGARVDVRGRHLEETIRITFNGIEAPEFEPHENQVRVVVPEGANTGRIVLTTLDGVTTSDMDFIVESEITPAPVFTSFNPGSGTRGLQVTVHGQHLTDVSEVRFGGAPSEKFLVESDTLLLAQVPPGARSGKISVTTGAGMAVSPQDFSVVTGEIELLTFHPTEDSFVWSKKPENNGGEDTGLRVRDTGMKQHAYLKFDVSGLTGRVESAVLFMYVKDGGEDGGRIYPVSSDYRDGSGPWDELGLNWHNAPAITGRSLSAFGAVKDQTVVEFDVTAAVSENGPISFAIKNSSSDVVLYDSKEGRNPPALVVRMETDPRFLPQPVITTFRPASGGVGTEVELIGQNLLGTTEIRFGGQLATGFNVDSDSRVRVDVPFGAKTGRIRVVSAGRVGESLPGFLVEGGLSAGPLLSGFEPGRGEIGVEVAIRGRHLTAATSVRFVSAETVEFSVDSDTLILAVVPRDAGAGRIKVTTPTGTVTSAADFFVVNDIGGGRFTFSPTDDAFVRSRKPLNNYGNWVELRVRKSRSAQQIAYFKFVVADLVGPVADARLRLRTTQAADEAGAVLVVSNNYDGTTVPWDEVGLNWTNSPRADGAPLSWAGSVGANEVVEFDVTSAISKDGTYSFAVKMNSRDIAKYCSKEGAFSPELIINTGSHLDRAAKPGLGPAGGATGARRISLPRRFSLGPNYPNPFNLETNIEYSLPAAALVRIKVFNLRGQKVRRLVDEIQTAGFKVVRWNGRDDRGREVASGIYILLMRAADQTLMDKMILRK